MTHGIDEIILNFTPEQYEKYLSVLNDAKKGKVELDFDISGAMPFALPCDRAVRALDSIESEVSVLLETRNEKRSFFFSSLTKDEIKALATLYYKTVMKISTQLNEINSFSFELIKNAKDAEAQYQKKVRIYQDFLPYLAALCENPLYKEKINALERSLYKETENSLYILKETENLLGTLEKICEEIIPRFLSKSGNALGAPPYDEFCATDFYSSINALIEQLKNEKRAFL